MSSGRNDPGNLVVKDPNAVNDPYGMDWTAMLADLGVGVTILTSTWSVSTISGDVAPLVIASDEVVPGGLVTQVYLSGGTVGRRYVVTNRIVTSSSPAVTDDRSFRVAVQER